MAFRVIQNALSVVVTQLRTLASLASEVDRLHFLLMSMETIATEVTIHSLLMTMRAYDVRSVRF